MSIVLVDLDGTVCDASHRAHMIHGSEKPDWESYSLACYADKPVHGVIRLVRELQDAGNIIVSTAIATTGASWSIRCRSRCSQSSAGGPRGSWADPGPPAVQ